MLNVIDAISPESYCNWIALSTRSGYTDVNPIIFLTPFRVTFALAVVAVSETFDKLLFSIITELSEKQQKERNYEIFSSIEQYEKGYPNETAVLGWILVLGSGEGNSRYVHKG